MAPNAIASRLDYYALLAAGNMPRLALAGIAGLLLGGLAGRGTKPRWVGTLAVTVGAGSALVSGAMTAAVLLRAHSLGLPIMAQALGLAQRRDQSVGGGQAWSEPELVSLNSRDNGWRIEADLYRPSSRGALTERGAIVVVHGGAWQHGDKGENRGSNQWLVERGYLVLDIRYTLAPVADWRVPVRDVRCAVAWLRAHAAELGIDPERVTLLGRSAGGHLALLAAYMPEGAIGPCGASGGAPWAVIAFYPPIDLLQAYAEDDEVREGLRALLGAEPGTGDRAYRSASPLAYVSGLAPPTLLIHGTWDHAVPLEHSRRLAASLAASGASVRLVEVPFARHAFDIVPDGLQTLLAHEAIAAFLEGRLAGPG
jgi:acetyl esterase/lipase